MIGHVRGRAGGRRYGRLAALKSRSPGGMHAEGTSAGPVPTSTTEKGVCQDAAGDERLAAATGVTPASCASHAEALMPRTYVELIQRGRVLMARNGRSAESCSTYASSFRRFLRTAGIDKASPIDEAFLVGFEETVERALSGVDKDAAKHLRSVANEWRSIHARLLGGEDLPPTLSEALRLLLQDHNMTVRELAQRSGVPERSVRDYVDGVRQIIGRPEDLAGFECIFGLPPETLIGRAYIDRRRSPTFCPKEMFPDWLQGSDSRSSRARTLVRSLLAESFMELEEKQREAALRAALDAAGVYESDGALMLNGRPPGTRRSAWLKKATWPERYQSEWSELLAFKVDDGSIHKKPGVGGGWRSPETIRRYHQILEAFAGFAVQPVAPGVTAEALEMDPGKPRPVGGLGRSPDDVTLGMLVDPDVSFEWMRFEEARAGGLNNTTRQHLAFARMLLQPRRGFLWLNPEWAERLPAGFVERAEQNADLEGAPPSSTKERWRRLCAATLEILKEYGRGHNERQRPTRDPFGRIRPILRGPEPDTVLDEMHAACMRDHRIMPVWMRDAFFMRVLLSRMLRHTAFRIGHFRKLRVTDLVRGADGSIAWNVPVDHFKNKRSSIFRSVAPTGVLQYARFPKDLQGMLAQYLDEVRPRLLRGKHHDFVFVKEDTGEPVTKGYLSTRIRKLTGDYLSEDGHRGVHLDGVLPFGPHAYRHILATTALKLESLDVAAMLLLDSLDVVRDSYTEFLPEDRLQWAWDKLDEARERHRHGSSGHVRLW